MQYVDRSERGRYGARRTRKLRKPVLLLKSESYGVRYARRPHREARLRREGQVTKTKAL